MTLNPDRYECPEHHTDLTGLVEEALEELGPPVAYRPRRDPAPVPGDRHLPRHRRCRAAPAHLHRDTNPMTSPVRPPSRADQAWADLATQLTPANSLARIDTVTNRAITTITVLGILLTGLGALAAGQFTDQHRRPGPGRRHRRYRRPRRRLRIGGPGADHHPPPQPRQPA